MHMWKFQAHIKILANPSVGETKEQNINTYESSNERPFYSEPPFFFFQLLSLLRINWVETAPRAGRHQQAGRVISWQEIGKWPFCIQKCWWFTITNVPPWTELLGSVVSSLTPHRGACTIMHNALMAVFHNCQRSCG